MPDRGSLTGREQEQLLLLGQAYRVLYNWGLGRAASQDELAELLQRIGVALDEAGVPRA